MNHIAERDTKMIIDGHAHASGDFLEPEGIIDSLGLKVSKRKNIMTNLQQLTNHAGVFAAGDARNGASLVVTAIHSGRMAAKAMHKYLIHV